MAYKERLEELTTKIENCIEDIYQINLDVQRKVEFKEKERDRALPEYERKLCKVLEEKAKEGTMMTDGTVKYHKLNLELKQVYYEDAIYRIKRRGEIEKAVLQDAIEAAQARIRSLQRLLL